MSTVQVWFWSDNQCINLVLPRYLSKPVLCRPQMLKSYIYFTQGFTGIDQPYEKPTNPEVSPSQSELTKLPLPTFYRFYIFCLFFVFPEFQSYMSGKQKHICKWNEKLYVFIHHLLLYNQSHLEYGLICWGGVKPSKLHGSLCFKKGLLGISLERV